MPLRFLRGAGNGKAALAARRALIEGSGLFDRQWYLAQNTDIQRSGRDPLEHLVTHGVNEWRDPGPEFDTAFYVAQNPAVAGGELTPLEHYIRIGRAAGLAARRAPMDAEGSFAHVLKESGLFDAEWYLAQNHDVRAAGLDPLEHLVTAGAMEWRDPGPGFSTRLYAERCPDFPADGAITPLEHYLRIGRAAGYPAYPVEPAGDAEFRSLLQESGLFDADWYLEHNSDVRRSGVDPFDHIVRSGAMEWRNPGPNFEADYYTQINPDYPTDGSISPLHHYLLIGRPSGILAELPPAYERWTSLFDTLSDRDRDWIDGAVPASPRPEVVALHVAGAQDAGFDGIAAAIAGQRGFRPLLRMVGAGGDLTPPAKALDDVADGAIVILTSGGARLRPQAAYAFWAALTEGDAELAYSDHDHEDAAGRRGRPVFKPAMSPVFMGQVPYAGPVVALRIGAGNRDRVIEALSRACDADPAQAFAALLLGTDRRRVTRVPLCLYALPLEGDAASSDWRATFEVTPGMAVPHSAPTPSEWPTVSILIPTRDRRELVEACVESIRSLTTYPKDRYRILVIDNDSSEPESVAYLRAIAEDPTCGVVPSPGRFNFAKICNDGAAATDAEVLVFLNNDIVVIDPDWLNVLAGHAIQPDVGAVGTKLLYPDDTVQHGGVVLGVQGVAAHRLVGRTVEETVPLDATREMVAVTGACLAVRRAAFEEAGGFDPVLAVAFNDVRLCVRLFEAGYRNLYEARPLLYHHESKSRGLDDTREKLAISRREAIYMRMRHAALFRDDPSYNPNLSLQKIGNLGMPPRVVPPWRRSKTHRRVLLLSTSHGLGQGVGCVVALQAEAFLARGWDVTVAGPFRATDHAYPGCKRVRLVTEMQAASLAVAEGYDCVVAHTPPFSSVARYFGHRPLLYLYDHGEPPPALFDNWEAREAVDWEKRFCAPLAKRVFAISRSIYDEQYREDAQILRNGNTHLATWSEDWEKKRAGLRGKFGFEGRFVILNVCRFHEQERRYKGVDLYATLAAEAAYAVPELAQHATFVIAGRGDESDVAHLRRAGLTVFPNVTDAEMAELYAASDHYVSLSQWEGYNLGIGQALAMGLEVTASDIPAHREFGVPTSNAFPKLCSLLAEAFARWDEGASKRTARRESWDVPLSKLVDILEEDVAADRAGPWL